jgi:hypothetical protein
VPAGGDARRPEAEQDERDAVHPRVRAGKRW